MSPLGLGWWAGAESVPMSSSWERTEGQPRSRLGTLGAPRPWQVTRDLLPHRVQPGRAGAGRLMAGLRGTTLIQIAHPHRLPTGPG